MPYVPVPKDLSTVKTKVALNLTKRQLICFGLAGAVGLPTYFLTRKPLGNEGAMLLMMGLMSPFFLMAMYERNGLPAEKLALNYIRARLVWPGKRVYKTENLYTYLTGEEEQFADENKPTGRTGKKSAGRRKAGKTEPGRSSGRSKEKTR